VFYIGKKGGDVAGEVVGQRREEMGYKVGIIL
jgi:hypothetical protein